ncbi:acyltransferase [Lutibacter sp. A80]|uniref:acyltransferase n=1 Tax=Lutibacter sp. A80 TaxID=2918453 RepID=UPI001F057716|nr:DapH/DapD/GlmU-related protein [Lutibacter sp. A80]UMB60340.1 acyltransferase [Lutibacter sp. A80]
MKGISNEQLSLNANIAAGLKVGENCSGLIGCTIDHGHCWLIEIGDNVVFAPQVYLLAHDTSTKRSLGYTKIGKVKIGDNCFIGARALIMPNVSIGNNTIIGAGSIVTKSIPANVVAAGNPAKVISSIAEYEKRIKKLIEDSPTYEKEYTMSHNINDIMKQKMCKDLDSLSGFVR